MAIKKKPTTTTKKRKGQVEETVATEGNLVKPQSRESSCELKANGGGDSHQGEVQKRLDDYLSDDTRAFYDSMFQDWDNAEFIPDDFTIPVSVDSLEASIGYSSLLRQMHQAFLQTVAYYKSSAGGSLSTEEARRRAFHSCTTKEEARKQFRELMQLPLESLNFVDLMELQSYAPRVAERFWERAKREGRNEFESGHLAANITFPVGYMKGLWNIARYLGVRESFIDDWNPVGGIEVGLIDMLAQSYFQWQYWLELTVKRSQTREREPHREYAEWMFRQGREAKMSGYDDGYWTRPTISEEQSLEQAVQMADRWNRIFMRTLRQLRDLRRYSPVTINNANQVNIAADGGKQINFANDEGG